jgi:hypothetical protein
VSDLLPWGMREDVEISFTIEGPATEVLADLRALRASHTRRKAAIRVATLRPTDRRRVEDQYLPEIVEGDASAAKEKANSLVRQCIVTAETERHLDDVIANLEIISRHSHS